MIHYNDPEYLYHSGVKGMKWGVRKDKYKSMSRADRRAARKDFKKKYNYDRQGAISKHVSKFRSNNKAYDRLADRIELSNKPGTKEQVKKYNEMARKESEYVDKNVKKDMVKKYGSKTVKSMQRRENAKSVAAGAAVYGALAGITYATVIRPIAKKML